MRGLLVKDLLILCKRKQNLIMFLFLSIFLSFVTGGYFILGYLPFLLINVAISTISYDEMDNGYSFLFSLPVSRQKYVLSKYVLMASVNIISCMLAFILACLINPYINNPMSIAEYVSAILVICPLFMLIISLLIPLHFKFSAEKLRVVYMVVYGMILLLVFGVKIIAEKMGIDAAVLNQNLLTVSKGFLYILGIIIFSALIYVSYLCSFKIINKKDF